MDSSVVESLLQAAAGWATVVRASIEHPNQRIALDLSFVRSLSASELAGLLSDVQGSLPVSAITRVDAQSRTLTVADATESTTIDPTATAPVAPGAVGPYLAAQSSSQADALDDSIIQLQADITDLQITGEGTADAAAEISAYQSALSDYQTTRTTLTATPKSGTAVTVVANPNLVLRRAARLPFLIVGASVSNDPTTATAARAGDSRFGAGGGQVDIAPPRIQIHSLRGTQPQAAESSATARRLATDPASRWSPNRFKVGSGLYKEARGDGRHLKRIVATTVWGNASLLAAYGQNHNLGLEYQVYPHAADGVWSGDWWNKAVWPVKKRQWTSDLPDAYLDDLFHDSVPVFAVGTPNGYKIHANQLYTMRYITDYGSQDTGSLNIEPQLTEQHSANAYCIGHLGTPSACQFARKTAHVDAEHPLALRNAAHWVCTAADDLNCTRDWERDPDGIRYGAEVSHCAPGEVWSGTECLIIYSAKRPTRGPASVTSPTWGTSH